MGNSSSGWYRGHAPRCEDYAVIDTAKEYALAWGYWTTKHWHWQGQRCSAELRIDRTAGYTLAAAGVTISYYALDDVGRCTHVVASERAAIVEQPVGFGGVRRWLCCPGCGSRIRVLYGGHRLRCRRCLGLRYRCQMLQRPDRAYRRATKIAQRCDPRATWGNGFPGKPKWMRWRTWERLAEHYEWQEALGLTSGVGGRFAGMFSREAAEVRAAYAVWRAEQRRR
jgi:hypothetical protein